MKKVSKLLVLPIFAFVVSHQANAQVTLKINKPMSLEDKQKVDMLLKNFDPNSYSFSASYIDATGKTKSMATGSAVGLAAVKMSKTDRIGVATRVDGVSKVGLLVASAGRASSVNHNNIFRASSVNHNNIFRASSVNHNNIFRPTDAQLSKMEELHQILSKYE